MILTILLPLVLMIFRFVKLSSKTGPFTPVGSVPEFRDLVVNPAPLPSPTVPVRGTPSRLSGTHRNPADAVDLGESPSSSGASGSRSGRGTKKVEGDTTAHALPPEDAPTPRRTVKSKPAKRVAKGFDWTPIVVVVVALASAAVGYLLFAK